jgi:hypothetical protein
MPAGSVDPAAGAQGATMLFAQRWSVVVRAAPEEVYDTLLLDLLPAIEPPVVDLLPNERKRRITHRTGSGKGTACWQYDCNPVDGGTSLTVWVRFEHKGGMVWALVGPKKELQLAQTTAETVRAHVEDRRRTQT